MNIDKIMITEAEKADVPVIYELCDKLVCQYENLAEINYNKAMTWIRQKLDSHIHEYKAVMYDGAKVAYFHFFENGEMMELDDLYVLNEYRNQGIGSYIIKKCIASTDRPIFLYVFTQNKRAMAFYERWGFVVYEQRNATRCTMIRR